MIIQHNLSSMMTNRQLGINIKNTARATERLSTGYKINKAADDTAGLTISEEMRRQIRGLMQASDNSEEGMDYTLVGDGAMAEIDAMLHRMREITVQALNDTNTEEDKAALEMEFDQIQSQIDEICRNTQFNGINIFDDHEPDYYKVAGNVLWDHDQIHEVDPAANDLKMKVKAADGTITEYNITVPPGIYTTQELLDEIDDAMLALTGNPGLSLEFSDGGYCNLNLEAGGEGSTIESVDGGLSYLIYGRYDGGAYGSLLGTTMFSNDWPLSITNENNQITFYSEKLDGSGSSKVDLKLPTGSYTRTELIDLINNTLASNGVTGVTAKEHGSSSIQIAGVDSIITGLKGNMFKLEVSGEDSSIHTSIFYDNVKYGTSVSSSAVITGKAYYNASYTSGFKIDNDNNVLKIKLDGAATYTNVTIPKSTNANGYTISELKTAFQTALDTAGVKAEVSLGSVYDYISGTGSVYMNYLILKDKETGSESKIEIDMNDNVSRKAYETLFRDTNYSYNVTPDTYSGYNASNYLNSTKNLTFPLNLSNKELKFKVGGEEKIINLSKSSYSNINELAADIEAQLPATLAGKISVTGSGGRLKMTATDSSIGAITPPATTAGTLFKELFMGRGEVTNSFSTVNGSGSIEYNQGSTAPTKVNQASVTLPLSIPSNSIKIDSSNNRFNFYLNGSSKSITLDSGLGTVTREQLISEINKELGKQNIPVKASLSSSNALTLTTTYVPSGSNINMSLQVRDSGYDSGSTLLKALVGTTVSDFSADYYNTTGANAYIQGKKSIGSNFKIDSSNDTFTFKYDGTAYTVKIDQKNNYNSTTLKDELQNKINAAVGAGKITVSHTGTGIRVEANDAGSGKLGTYGGNFYSEVLTDKEVTTTPRNPTNQDGKQEFKEAYVIGRQDLASENTEIVSNLNDKFIVDFNYPDPADPSKIVVKSLEVTIPAGNYTGNNLATVIGDLLNDELAAEGLDKFEIDARIGGHSTGVIGNNDSNALQLTLKLKDGESTESGKYYLDGIRGSSAYIIFYKSTGKPVEPYVVGAEDITDGVTIKDGKNVFSFTTDGVDYEYEIPPKDEPYTAQEFIDTLNGLIQGGDKNGNVAPLRAMLDNGVLKLAHNSYGTHSITNIGGSAKGAIFYHEEGRETQNARMLQVGDDKKEDLEIPRINLNTNFLRINSVTISKNKYADKALERLDYALEYLNKQRARFGSFYNRLSHIVASNDLTVENTQISESRIRDADMADEMVSYSKSNILMQAGQSLLAQANQLTSNVLTILG